MLHVGGRWVKKIWVRMTKSRTITASALEAVVETMWTGTPIPRLGTHSEQTMRLEGAVIREQGVTLRSWW